ncbi:MAG: hypothetical protein M3198_17075 [Actinomycetota bacterium]|nr:hypothetical protein [Actinomycetota bacterium]
MAGPAGGVAAAGLATRDAAEVIAEEVKALALHFKVDDPGLALGELEPELGQEPPQRFERPLRLALLPAEDHQVVGVAGELAELRVPLLPRPIERVQ